MITLRAAAPALAALPAPTTAVRPTAPVSHNAAGRLGFGAVVAMSVGALLGPGVLVLPALAAATAGPASLAAWAVLLVASVPIAATFTALAVRYPQAGGVAGIVARAFGERAGAVVGWWFFVAVPVVATTSALIGGQYLAAVMGAGRLTAYAVAVAILVLVFAANAGGVHLSGRVQLGLVAALAGLLLVVIVTAAPHVDLDNFVPFMPRDAWSVGQAVALLFVAVAGWEACSTLTPVVDRPRRTLPRVAAVTIAVLTVLYLGLAAATVGVLGPDAASTDAPLLAVVTVGLGPAAGGLVAVVALLLTAGAANVYVAGAAHAGAALAESGHLPAWIGRRSGGEPRRSLAVQAAATAAVTAVCCSVGAGTGPLLRVVSVLLAAVAVAGVAAGVMLLRGRAFIVAVAATAVTVAVLAAAGPAVLAPAVVTGAALLWTCLPARAAPARLVRTAGSREPSAAVVAAPTRASPASPRPARRRRRRRRKRRVKSGRR
ncbi:APC family permease [Dactylosporangium sp. NPDC051485]|uniref:APC family permease n=1 Tax=Dactylosporangium sp. NPDC051485 TaxID=3154846 RepID=UPI00342BA0F6